MATNEEATPSQKFNHGTRVTSSDHDINSERFLEATDGIPEGSQLELEEDTPKKRRYTLTCIKCAIYNHRGLFYILLSSLFYALLGVFVQLSTAIHEMEEGFVRGIFLSFFSVFGIIMGNTKLVFSKRQYFWITINGCLNAFAQIGAFAAYNLTAVGDATAVMYSMPAFSGVMAWIFLKEPLTLLGVIFTIICIIGVFLVSKPAFIFNSGEDEEPDSNFIGTMWAFSVLISLSCACIVTRKLRQGSTEESCDSLILTLVYGVFVTITCAILNTLIGEWCFTTDVAQLCYALGIGLSGFFGIYFYALSLKNQKALIVSVVFTTCILMTFIFQFAIFHDYPDLISGLGIIAILLSVFGVLLTDWRKESKLARSYATVEQSTTS